MKRTILVIFLVLSVLAIGLTVPTPEPIVPTLQIFKKQHHHDTDLFRTLTRIYDLTTDFQIGQPSHMTAIGHVNLRHRGIPFWSGEPPAGCDPNLSCCDPPDPNCDREYAVGFSLRLTLKYSETQSGLGPDNDDLFPPVGEEVVGSITGANINGHSDHYTLGSIEGYEFLTTPGWYRLEVWGTSESDGLMANTDGLIDVNPTENGTTYNQLIVRVEDASDNVTSLHDENMQTLPEAHSVSQNFPNPFNPTTTINYSLPSDQFVSIKIYNINGQEIRTLLRRSQPQGEYSITWNGEDDRGNSVSSGVYFFQVTAGEYKMSIKITLLR